MHALQYEEIGPVSRAEAEASFASGFSGCMSGSTTLRAGHWISSSEEKLTVGLRRAILPPGEIWGSAVEVIDLKADK